jgi:hypothetical protein
MDTLAEDLLLLALDDEEGTVSWRHAPALPYGLGGAILMDLVLRGRIASADRRFVVGDPAATGDAVLDAGLAAIRAADKPHDARYWVKRFGRRPGVQEQLARRLVARGILHEQERTFLRVFHAPRFPTGDPGPEAALRAGLRAAVLGDAAPDRRTVLLLSLLHACHLADGLFPAAERGDIRRRVKDLVAGERFGEAVGQAIADVVAATTATAAAAFTVTVAPGAQH